MSYESLETNLKAHAWAGNTVELVLWSLVDAPVEGWNQHLFGVLSQELLL